MPVRPSPSSPSALPVFPDLAQLDRPRTNSNRKRSSLLKTSRSFASGLCREFFRPARPLPRRSRAGVALREQRRRFIHSALVKRKTDFSPPRRLFASAARNAEGDKGLELARYARWSTFALPKIHAPHRHRQVCVAPCRPLRLSISFWSPRAGIFRRRAHAFLERDGDGRARPVRFHRAPSGLCLQLRPDAFGRLRHRITDSASAAPRRFWVREIIPGQRSVSIGRRLRPPRGAFPNYFSRQLPLDTV